MPPMSCTSYGTMSHLRAWPVTTTSLPKSRRHASRTVAKASGSASFSVTWSALTYAASAWDSFWLSSTRCSASGQACFSRFRRSTSAASVLVRSAMRPRSFGVWPCSSPSDSPLRRASWRLIASTMGRMRFSALWNWVPKILVNQPLYINPLFAIQPAGRDVVADGIGHQIPDGAALPHPLPDYRGRHIHRRHFDDPTDGRVSRQRCSRSREHYHVRQRGERLDLIPGGQLGGRIGPQQ